jgi:hypothetical protein
MKWAPLVVAAALLLAAQTAPLEIVTTHLPEPRAGQPYHAELRAQGGTPPYRWTALNPGLPQGLRLNPATGVIAGALETDRPFRVLIQLEDSATPPLAETRLLVTAKGPPLALAWTAAPAFSDGEIRGALKLRNDSGDTLTATVIVAAVNEVGKAFALRYDHRDLAPGDATPELAFAVALPPGAYTLGADAIGEVPAQKAIYRTRLAAPNFTVPGGVPGR